ncbi:NACHT domain-containing protein [Clostridium perfringens]|uniref:NACHT domain-containing protein n=1 Tax=Clostridium perfringens TaxID=1502 RepID=UPI003BA8667F
MSVSNWDDFNRKNKDKTKAFEDLCRLLFLREKNKSSYEYVYDTNEAGLEFKPVLCDNKWFGIQCKYFSSDIDSSNKYKEIYSSIHRAIRNFKNQLDVIYVYTNGEFKENLKENELEKAKEENKKLTTRQKIWDECIKNNIELKFVKADHILDSVKSRENIDLYRLYFTEERKLDFLTSLITPDEKTFLNSDEFLDLNFENSSNLIEIKNGLNQNKFSLVLGDAGTGKSLALKKLCDYILKDYTKFYFEKTKVVDSNILFPVLIKLRECTNGNIEEIIRNRLRDYNISRTNNEKQICYLFDGLDEIPVKDVTSIINHIKRISEEVETKAIIVSSRCDSTNLVYLNQVSKWTEYKIEDLSKEQKIQFLESKKSILSIETLKLIKESKLLDYISDIFSLNLLYENIELIDINGSKIELIEISINSLFERYQKLPNINILYPKVENILNLCTEIAYIMQKNNRLYIELDEIHGLIRDVLFTSDIKAINSIVEMLLETCFERSFSFNMTFKHRRIQEYFLYRKIESEYYNNPNILRDLNLLANRDFICNVFLQTSLKRALRRKDFFKLSSLRLLESYLGRDYISDFSNDIIIGDKYNHVEANYKYSERLFELLATYTESELDMLFKNDRLGILDIFKLNTLNENTFIKLIKVYWEVNNVDITNLLKKYKLIPEKCKLSEELIYCLLEINKVDIRELYEKIKKNKRYLSYFFKLLIKKDLSFIESIIYDLDVIEFECLCEALLNFENISILYYREKHTELFDLIKNKIIDFDTEYDINTKILFSFITSDERFNGELEKEFEKYNKGHFWTWTDNLEISIYMSIILKKTDRLYLSEFNFGAKIIENLYENRGNDSETFEAFKNVLIESNYTCKDALNFVNTRLLGIILANINFDLNKIKGFLRLVFNYESVININELIFRIYTLNKNRFFNISNQAMLSRLELNIGNDQTKYYDEIVELLFSLGAMYSKFSPEKRHELLVKGIDNSICRPAYESEMFVGRILIECIYKGYESYWFDKQVLERLLLEVYLSLKIISNRTENNTNMEYLKWVLTEYNINTENFEEIYDIQPKPFNSINNNVEFNKELIDLTKIDEYYKFEVGQMPYNSIEFWEYIIEYGYKHNNLDILIDNLNKNLYLDRLEDIYIPIVILLRYNDFKEKVSMIVSDKFGRFGIYNIVKIITLNDNFGDRMEYLNHMIKFMYFLIQNDIENQHESEWFEYKKEDWKINEIDNEIYFKKDRSIKIVWNDYEDREKFNDEWATKHIDTNAYKYNYILYVNNIKIKEFSLIWVDGYRALLPIPKKYGENIVERDKYLICRLLNSNTDEFNRYMRSSGLIVE